MIERVTLILDLFRGPAEQLTLEEVSNRTNLPRSSAHRILEQLSNVQWVSRSPAGYRLGPRARGLGRLAGGDSALRSAAAPVLYHLAMVTGMVAHLAILDGDAVVYLDKVGGRQMADVPSRVGGRSAAHSTTPGRAMLAWLPAEEVDDRLLGLGTSTSDRIPDLSVLHRDLERIRARNGLTFGRGETSPHIGCVAVGVRGPDGPVGAVSLVGDSRAPLERVAPLVIRAARKVAHDLELPEDVHGGQLALEPVHSATPARASA
ncbi:IclR family transcriptional regulator [Nocardioides immobilis]|uniref:IclR family transcriptional regulator n=1 Tax=Nocardioides immobilis TaxID=2049295 RepID=A0A417XTN3_9ACTN|nr:IclR family transcriptional regulator [Nocardioides immobilis]RHW23655.1 IclR family transcriptional regulator [Nocardioides immobilis]